MLSGFRKLLPGIVGVLIAIGFLTTRANAQFVPFRLARPEEIHDMLVERIDGQHKSGGIVVGVITKKAREIFSYGHFDPEDPRVPDGDTVFEIGSISKVFTSVLLADMVVKGEVSLSDPISEYLPATVHAPTRDGKQITLLDLATHYSGLPPMPSNFSWDYSREQMFDFLSHYQLTRDPGTRNSTIRTLGLDCWDKSWRCAPGRIMRRCYARASPDPYRESHRHTFNARDESRLHPRTRLRDGESSRMGGACFGWSRRNSIYRQRLTDLSGGEHGHHQISVATGDEEDAHRASARVPRFADRSGMAHPTAM